MLSDKKKNEDKFIVRLSNLIDDYNSHIDGDNIVCLLLQKAEAMLYSLTKDEPTRELCNDIADIYSRINLHREYEKARREDRLNDRKSVYTLELDIVDLTERYRNQLTSCEIARMLIISGVSMLFDTQENGMDAMKCALDYLTQGIEDYERMNS